VSETLRDVVPRLYAPLLSDFFDRPAITETRATCGDCAMCDAKGPVAGSQADLDVALFRPDIKCCSYHPTLPNYLVGAILSDGSPELESGRRRIQKKIAGRVGVTPHWLAAPRKYLVLLAAARESSFGRSESLLCPYYERDGGTCSIWPHRESVCATFFCKHVAGATGHAFWAALRRYMEHVERTLARHAAKSAAPGVSEPFIPRNVLTREDLEDRPPSDADYARSWGDWSGREEELYVKCADHVRALGRGDFAREVDDATGRELLAAMKARYGDVTEPKLSPRLVLNRDMRVVPGVGGVGVTTYSRYDALFLTQDLYDALAQFTGEDSVETVLERLQRDHDIDLPKELLLELQLHGVVTAAGEEPLP
jgi:Fe-S-cluster containining protein